MIGTSPLGSDLVVVWSKTFMYVVDKNGIT